MKILIAEDDFTSRLLLQELLKEYGSCHIAVNGEEAVAATRTALEAGDPYHLICLDIMMPKMDGRVALNEIRDQEEARGISFRAGSKILMTSALEDGKDIFGSFYDLCNGYLVKPVDKARLLAELHMLGLTS